MLTGGASLSADNGQLYGGTLPSADVYRYAGGSDWVWTGCIDDTPDVIYRRAWSAAIYDGDMFFGSLPAGLVSRFRRAGQLAVSADRDLFAEAEASTLSVAAVKRGGSLELWADGSLVASATAAADDPLSDDVGQLGSTLRVGEGAIGKLAGVKNVQVHDRALSAAELETSGATSKL